MKKMIVAILITLTALISLGCNTKVNGDAKTAEDAETSTSIEAERKARLEAEMRLRDTRALAAEGAAAADEQFAPRSASVAMSVQTVSEAPSAPSPFPQPAPQPTAGLPVTPFAGPTYDPYYGSVGPTVGYVGDPGSFPLESECQGMCVAMFNRSNLPFSVQVDSELMTHMYGGYVRLSVPSVVVAPGGSRSIQSIPLVPAKPANTIIRRSPGRVYFLYNCDEGEPRCMMGGPVTVTVRARYYRMTPGERFAKPVGCWSQTFRLPHNDPWGKKLYPEYRMGRDC